ncbi:MAG TPA: hypothetical protein VFN30_03730 [Chitinophagaceae bacterium]|nr:hypothetical protein [Chitinophagaceae bacterium]
MDRDFYTDDFEWLLKSKAEEIKMYPSESVWRNVFNKLHPGRRLSIISGSALLLLFVTSVLVLRTNNKNVSTQKAVIGETETFVSTNTTVKSDQAYTDINNVTDSKKNTSLSLSAANSNQKLFNNKLVSNKGKKAIDNFSYKGIFAKQPVSSAKPGNTLYSDLSSVSPSQASPESELSQFTLSDKNAAFNEVNLILLSGAEKKYIANSNASLIDAISSGPFLNTRAANKFSKFEWQLYFTPSLSYRALFNDNASYNLSFAYNSFISGNIDKTVNHTPALGFELGNAVAYSVNSWLKIKAGVQFNYSRYNIKAYSSYPELTTLRLSAGINQSQTLTVSSSYKTYGSYSNATTIASQNTAISLPVGVDLKLAGNNKLSWAIASSLQPTVILNNKAYIVTNDLKNYVRKPDVFRSFVVNSSFETYLRLEKGNGVALQLGPQLRYQISSSYTQKYAISEHLLEYGIKVGIIKRLSK